MSLVDSPILVRKEDTSEYKGTLIALESQLAKTVTG